MVKSPSSDLIFCIRKIESKFIVWIDWYSSLQMMTLYLNAVEPPYKLLYIQYSIKPDNHKIGFRQWTQKGHAPDSKVHGTNMGPIWGQQDPGGPHVGPMNFAICGPYLALTSSLSYGESFASLSCHKEVQVYIKRWQNMSSCGRPNASKDFGSNFVLTSVSQNIFQLCVAENINKDASKILWRDID